MSSVASIEINKVSKTFPGKSGQGGWKALDGATFTVKPGEFVCILGPSGCGKSTLLNILGGLDDQYEGVASILGRPVDEQIANGVRVAYVFQEPRLMPWRTVRSNIEFALHAPGFAPADCPEPIYPPLPLFHPSAFSDFYPLHP